MNFFGFVGDTRPGKHTKNYGKSPFGIGKSTVNEPFSIAMLNCQRVFHKLKLLTEIVASAIMKSPRSSIAFCFHDIPLIVEYTVATSQFEMWLMYVDIHS